MRTTVALLFGGRSGEHGISCVTAGGILAAIDRERFEVMRTHYGLLATLFVHAGFVVRSIFKR